MPTVSTNDPRWKIADLRGVAFHRAMLGLCESILANLDDWRPVTPPSRPARNVMTDDDMELLELMQRVKDGHKLESMRQRWINHFRLWKEAVQVCEVQRQSAATQLLTLMWHANEAGDETALDTLVCFMGAEWNLSGEIPGSREDAERIAAGLARCRGIMSDELFYGNDR